MADTQKKYHFMNILLASILVVGLFIRLWGINHEIYTDENKVITPSVLLAQGKQVPLLYPKGSYYPHFYHYILGVAFLPPALMHMPYPSADTSVDIYTLIARIVTAIIGTATLYVVWKIGKLISSPRLGLIAALLIAFLPLHVKYSHYAHVDIPLTFVATCALFAALQIWKLGTMKWYVLAGILTGISGATHYTGFVIGIAIVLAHIMRSVETKTSAISSLVSKKLILAILLIPISFACATPYTLLKWKESYAIYHQLQLRGSAGDLGYTRPDYIWPITTSSPDWGLPFTVSGLWWEATPVIILLALVGILLLIKTRNWALLVILGGSSIVMYLAIIGRLPLYAVKRLLPLTPLLTLLAAYAIDALLKKYSRIKIATYAIWIGTISFLLYTAYFAAGFDAAYAGGSTHSKAVAWVLANIPHESIILQHTPIRLLDWSDPNYKTVRIDEVYANFNAQDPEVSHDRAKPLSYWTQEKGVQYIAMDSRIVDRYFDPTSVKLFPETTASYQAFYNQIRTQGKKVYSISPQLWHIAGPRVEIYDIRNIR